VFVQLMKTSWQITKGTKLRVEVGFDRNLDGVADSAQGEYINAQLGSLVTFHIGNDRLADFMHEFGEANHLWVRFPGGNEQPWVIEMTGSRNAKTAFMYCVNKVRGLPPATQPYGTSPSTQPFQQQPQVQAPSTPPTTIAARPTGRDSVPIIVSADGKMVHVDMIVGGQPVRMHLDTGATQMTITEAIATKIVRDRQGSYGPKSKGKLADGTIHETYTVLINEVRIGTHTIRNVTAAIMDSLLLPFPLVNDIAPFTVDTRAGELVFHTSKS
jgi:hypothetical protein